MTHLLTARTARTTRKSTQKHEVVCFSGGSSVVAVTGISKTEAKRQAAYFGKNAIVRAVRL